MTSSSETDETSESEDLTRWNRAGLQRFRYVNGNAITYLDTLREALAKRFGDWDRVNAVAPDPDTASTEQEKIDLEGRLQEHQELQYREKTNDPAWEVVRAFARSLHILGETLDTYSNESYLGTATQWENVRRLVQMLDYRPAPPASATTYLVLEGKEGMQGTVETGFQTEYAPPEGGDSVLFETLADLEIDARLNAFRSPDAELNPDPLIPLDEAEDAEEEPEGDGEPGDGLGGDPGEEEEEDDSASEGELVQLEGEVANLKIGEPLLIEDELTKQAWAFLIDGVIVGTKTNNAGEEITYTQVRLYPPKLKELELPKGRVLVHTNPKESLGVIRPLGDGVFEQEEGVGGADIYQLYLTEAPEDLAEGSWVYLASGNRSYFFELAAAVEEKALTFSQDVHQSDTLENATVSLPEEITIETWIIKSLPEGQTETIPTEGNPSPASPYQYSATIAGDWEHLNQTRMACSIASTVSVGPFFYYFQIMTASYSPVLMDEGDGQGYTDITFKWILDPDGTDESTPNNPPNVPAGAVGVTAHAFFAAPRDTGLWTVDRLIQKNDHFPNRRLITEIPTTISDGDYAVLLQGDGLVWAKLSNVAIDEDKGEAKLVAEEQGSVNNPRWFFHEDEDEDDSNNDALGYRKFYQSEAKLFGHFAAAVRVDGWDVNEQPLHPEDDPDSEEPVDRTVFPVDTTTLSEDDLAELQNTLEGRSVMVECGDDPEGAFVTTVEEFKQVALVDGTGAVVDSDAEPEDEDSWVLILADPIPADCTTGSLTVSANVVMAGHGKTLPTQVLGSGDATQTHQTFLVEVPEIAFIPDLTFANGRKAAVEVSVNNRVWEQVSTLNDSGPTDFHYDTRMTEDGFLEIRFGDGEYGRRLPTASNNIRITYRQGTGSAGNLDAGSFTDPLKPHPLVEGLHQPLPSSGGDEMEGLESIREYAPASTLALDRAVSLTDFAQLARNDSRVSQAVAFNDFQTGLQQKEKVKVVIVPGENVDVDEVKEELSDYLEARALPTVEVTVDSYDPVVIDLDITIRVISEAYEPEEVVNQVKAALQAAYGIKNRSLGQALYRGDLYHVVENIEGVENSDCIIADFELPEQELSEDEKDTALLVVTGINDQIKALKPHSYQVIHLDSTSQVTVHWQEYDP